MPARRGLPGISMFLICSYKTATAAPRCPAAEAAGLVGYFLGSPQVAMLVGLPTAVDADHTNLGGSACRRQQVCAHRRIGDVPSKMPQRYQRVRFAAAEASR